MSGLELVPGQAAPVTWFSTAARHPRCAAVALVLLVAGGIVLLLDAEGQGAVLISLAGFGALAFVTQGTRTGAAFVAAARTAPRTLDAAALVAALSLVVIFREDDYTVLMIATVGFFAMACLGLNIQMAFAGVVNFAAGAFFAVGAYTAAILMARTALPHILVLVAAGATAGMAGLVVLLPVLRTRGHYAALVTIAFGVLPRSFLEVNDSLGGTRGLKIPSFSIFGLSLNGVREIAGFDVSFYVSYALMAVAAVSVLACLVRRLENSWIGIALDLVRSDETVAAVFGIGIARWKATAFVLGNGLIGVAGAGYGIMNGFVSPNSASFEASLLVISIVVLGGLGSLWGVVAGATIILVVPEKLQSIQEYRLAIFSALVLVVLLFRPAGILPRQRRDLSRFQIRKVDGDV